VLWATICLAWNERKAKRLQVGPIFPKKVEMWDPICWLRGCGREFVYLVYNL
jgi:hypothetical protein